MDEEGSSEHAQPSKVILTRYGDSLVDLTGKVHLLPCCIKYSGPTSVSDYFKTKSSGMEVDGIRVEEAHFRGRKLHGTTLPLLDGYCGFILGKRNSEEKASALNFECWKTNATFQDVTIWNHDVMPSKDDAVLRAFHWFRVANALHRPVTAEDLECACTD